MTPDELARLDRDLPPREAIDAEIDRRQGLVEMRMLQERFGHKKGQLIHVSPTQAEGHEALGSAERTSATKERIQRAERHLEKVTKKAGLHRVPSGKELCEELHRRGWRETATGWGRVK